jgi:hypothetical protein
VRSWNVVAGVLAAFVFCWFFGSHCLFFHLDEASDWVVCCTLVELHV